MRILLTLLLLPFTLAAQGFDAINFSQVGNGNQMTQTNVSNSWYGYRNGTNGSSGANIATSAGVSIGSNNASTLAITANSTWRCSDGIPNNNGGASALYFDYDASKGGGHQNVYVGIQFPSVSNGQVFIMSGWMCITADLATTGTFDDWVVTGISPSALSNLVCGSGSCNLRLEGTCGQNSWPVGDCNIPVPIGTTFQIAAMFTINGTCSGTINTLQDAINANCIILAAYDRNGSILGFAYKSTGGTPGTGCSACQPTALYLGDLNGAATHAGFVQHANVKICAYGCQASQFPILENPVPLWDGVINNPQLGTNWQNAGIPGNNNGALPSSGWTQFGSTLTAGAYAGATITANMSGCNNQFYQLGAGTFTVTGIINIPSNCELRGLGSNTTFLVASGAGSACRSPTNSLVCIKNTGDQTFIGNTPSVDCNWTAGYAQSAKQITLSSCTGAGVTSIVSGTILAINQCGTGFSGANNCTGTATDNGNLYICQDKYAVTPTGCSSNGGGSYERPSIELPVVTAINTGTGVATISPPLTMPNYASGFTPQAQIIQPVTLSGVSNLSIDLSAGGVASVCVQLFDGYKVWINAVRCVNNKFAGFQIDQTANYIIQNSYLYGSTATPPSGYAIRPYFSAYGLIANNIVQNIYTPMFQDSPTMATVWAYNFVINCANPSNSFMNEAFTDHWPNFYTLAEGNVANQFNADDVHGAAGIATTFRNLFTGWESTPSTPKTSNTVAIQDNSFTRYHNRLFDVYGTPGYHTVYSNLASSTSTIWEGQGIGGVSPPVPNDSLTAATTLRWGSYNVAQALVRWCGNTLDTGWVANCSSTTESPSTASTYPNYVPPVGDTGIGQAAGPASFIFTARPSWYASTIAFPAIGPDVTSGNVGQCSGALNTIGQFNGLPALTNAQCGNHGITASAWGGHINAIPAMACYLNTMGGPADGSGGVLAFDSNACYSGALPPVIGPAVSIFAGMLPSGKVGR